VVRSSTARHARSGPKSAGRLFAACWAQSSAAGA